MSLRQTEPEWPAAYTDFTAVLDGTASHHRKPWLTSLTDLVGASDRLFAGPFADHAVFKGGTFHPKA
jgi:hypothetical protein